MSKDRRLGRGLAALLGGPMDEAAPLEANLPPIEPLGVALPETTDPANELLRLNVHEIDDNPFQPRRDFGTAELASLAESLKEHDMLQPILVRRHGSRYQLISGERRLRAAIQAGWKTVPARLREADDRQVAELAIVENLQRRDLNPIEKATSFRRYLDQHACTQDELAARLKIDRSTIANLMRLLELPETVRQAIGTGELSAGHARALLPLGDEAEQIAFAQQIKSEGLSVRATEQLVQLRLDEDDDAGPATIPLPRSKPTKSEQVASLEQEFRMATGTKVEIRQSGRGRGKIVLHFGNEDEFERIRELISGDTRPAVSSRAVA